MTFKDQLLMLKRSISDLYQINRGYIFMNFLIKISSYIMLCHPLNYLGIKHYQVGNTNTAVTIFVVTFILGLIWLLVLEAYFKSKDQNDS